MSRIYWDSMLFIYWLEENPQFSKRVGDIYSRMMARGDQLLTSSFALGEVLAGVYRRGRAQLAGEMRVQILELVSEVVGFTIETADRYAQIRGSLLLPAADAIHLASAAQTGSDLFLTNDKRLVGKFVPGIHFIASLDDDVL